MLSYFPFYIISLLLILNYYANSFLLMNYQGGNGYEVSEKIEKD